MRFLSTGRHLLGFFVCNKPKGKFMHRPIHTEHYTKEMYYVTGKARLHFSPICF